MSSIAAEHNIATYCVGLVAALGSDTVFSLTGGMAMYLNRAVAVHPSLKRVYCQHEQACVAAAEGYAKAADFRRAGFAVVTAGPGVSNTVTSLISAYGDSTPLVVLAGQIKTDDIDRFGTRTHGVQEIRSREIVTPCVKRFARLSVRDFREVLADALVEAFVGRPGPVFIEVPLDVQGVVIQDTTADIAAAASEIEARIKAAGNVAGQDELVESLRQILRAKRPLIYVGNGCRVAGVEAAVCDFLTAHQIPAVFSWLSFDILPGGDDLHFGCPGGLAPISANEILSTADAILFLGARLDLGTTAFQRAAFGPQAERHFVDVDTAELAKFEGLANSRRVQADLRGLPAAIIASREESRADSNWLPWCRAQRVAYLEEERQRLTSANTNVYGVASRLSAVSDGKVFVSASSGYAEETFTRFFVPGKGTRFFNGAALGAMGMGLSNAIGAAYGSPRPVVCLEADGGIMLNIQELATLSHYAPKGFVLIVFNNGGYESIRSSQTRHFGGVSGADQETGVFIPDFGELARTFHLDYSRIDTLAELEAGLRRHTDHDPPVLLEVMIDKFEYRGPSVKTIMDANGRPSSTPLAEIDW